MSRFLFSLLAASTVLVASHARADCANGSSYDTSVSGNTVTIGLDNTDRVCPDASGMLRENEATGEVVVLGDFCGKSQYESAYVDECVPQGTYRYGLALSYDCSHGGCGGVEIFHEVTVVDPLNVTCTRSSGNPGPTTTNEAPPWGTGAEIEQFKACPGHGCFCDTATATVVSINSFALGVGLIALVASARLRRRRRS